MKNNVKKVISIVLIMVMMFALAACSAKTSSEVKTTEDQKVATKLDQIKEKGKIVLGTSADYPPYEFHKETNGKDEIVGFDIEIAKAVAKELGVELEIKDMKFEGLLAALVTDDIDFVIAGMVPKEERKQSVDFSVPYYQAEQKILIKASAGEKVKSIADLKGFKIGAQKSTVQEDIAKAKIEASEVKSLSKITDLVLELKSGKIDGVVLVAPVADAYAKKNNDLVVADLSFGKEDGVAVAVNKGKQDLLSEINKTLDKLIKDGSVDKFIEDATLLADQ